MEFIQNHWGGLASVLGLLVSLIGLAWAIREARGAKSAALETRERIGRHLVIVDLERAVALIQRVKLLHDTGRWEGALEQYQPLRDMLSAILARYPDENMDRDRRQRLTSARNVVSTVEVQVESQLSQGLTPETQENLHRLLNRIQADLEDMANSIGLGDE